MRKISTLVVTALLISTVSGCSYRNTAMRNYPNQGTTQGTRTGYQTGTIQGTYRDGVYSGVGNSGASGNQTATVVIKGGRITNITLGTIDNRGVEMYPQNMGITQGTTGTNTGSTTGNNTGNVTGSITQNNTRNNTTNNYANQGARTYGTPGATTGGMAGGMASDVNDNNTIGNTGRTGVGTNNYGPYTGSNTGTTTGGVNNVSPNGNGQYNIAKKQIEAAMISAQTYDVNINGSNTNVGQNWKLAVRRALDRARY